MQVGERRADNRGIWGKLTIPLVISILLHAGTIIWWARGIQENIALLEARQTMSKDSLLKEFDNISIALADIKSDVKDNETRILECMLGRANAQ